jgi:NAD(P)-dependent dehydrogenase (short-subunit alcohol dehydrogenase family)
VVFTHTGDPRRAGRAAALAEEVRAEGGWARAEALDARDAQATAELAERLAAELGRLDALVCNVGRNDAQPAESQSESAWRDGIELNLSTAFYGVRAVLPHMLRAGYGRILFIGSSAVADGGGGAIDYAAAKAGLAGLASYLCRTYARAGILANLIHPAAIATELLAVRYGEPEARRQLTASIPVGRLGRPEDVAALAAYLLSPWGDFICGQAILVDGGRTLFNR